MDFQPTSSIATINGKNYQLIAFYFPGHNTPWDNYYNAPYLGNFWQSKLSLTIHSKTGIFQNSEAAFQATKWWDDDAIRQQFENALTGDDAFQIKKKLHNPDYSFAGLGRDEAMKKVLKAKFQEPNLKSGLFATNNAYLLEHNSTKGRDDYWSDDSDGSGQNKLGLTLMEVRHELGGQKNPYSGQVLYITNQVKQ